MSTGFSQQGSGRRDLTGMLVAGRYRILGYLGEGATGMVWRAEHLALERECAVKILKNTDVADSLLAARFRREAKAASRLDHPNIVYISDFGRIEDGSLYLVMEHIPGPSLREVIQSSKGALPRNRCLGILCQVAAALEAAHEAGVVHRDIKPENILLQTGEEQDDLVKVLDFSLAKILDGANLTCLTRKGDLFGTPAYMAPEQVSSGPTGPTTDIYSFGVLAFELFTGRLPFTGPSIPAIMLAHREAPPPSPSHCLPTGARPLPKTLESLILQCMEKRPEKRPARAVQLKQTLDDLRRMERAPTSTYAVEQGGAPTSLDEDHNLRVSRRLWAREQAGRTAARLVLFLRREGHVQPATERLLLRIEDILQQRDRLGNDVALLVSQRGDEERRRRDSLARLRYALAELSEERGHLMESGMGLRESLVDLDFQIHELERALAATLAQSEAQGSNERVELRELQSRESVLDQRLLESARKLALTVRTHPEMLYDTPEARTELEDLVALLRLVDET